MNMKEFSSAVGLSSYTLRYYEKIGLLKHVHRNNSGHRVYTHRDIDWVNFIKRLKETGMPLEEIQEYASLRELGSQTTADRQKLLEVHRDNLIEHIRQQNEHLKRLEEKIDLYKSGKVR
ncbi:MerR family transcriptional regulator [Vibrio parahaemolyticus]|uniref:MerR family transcriptional regulator n=1 Tax=Vibrio parahaemolyticus TaxID=670 RepID=UPI00040869AC|nr:MerR family transcriptional regulator [Vibrio parahaemolyticus]EJC6797614.1 MerR family transcriptional regulator [Vibrio parahaemolyticus]EJC7055154.1 MerR family transcriptional regulator [Vibrio parahaemolyticus]EJC7097555.1 MerR family transcriptional regulator [Vibrio parahaemolyticus]EJC7112498.1 MerR family transcriptional regulator [Vibrio parahaemolyticus]EJC7129806.1 MerR family transcriptional regulator [Vibrio parahaemolyticus]